MQDTGIESFKNRSRSLGYRLFLILSLIWLTGCFSLLIPQIRLLILAFGEFLIHRPLNNPKAWSDRLFSSGAIGIICYFLVFFHEKIFTQEKSGKKWYILVFVITALMIFFIMFQANWTFGDDHVFIKTTAINRYQPLFILPSIGRFFPITFLHYNMLLFIFRLFGINSGVPAAAHFVLVALLYIITILCLYLFFKKIKPAAAKEYPRLTVFFVCVFPLWSNAFAWIFMEIIFPETIVIALFAFFMLMYFHALETDKKRYYIAAFIAAVYSTYCKEPVFGAFIVIALFNHLFRFKDETKKEKIFYGALIANGILFLILLLYQ